MKWVKFISGRYRMSGREHFAQTKHGGSGWLVEIRVRDTGDLCRFAGIWKTLREAGEEAERVLRAM